MMLPRSAGPGCWPSGSSGASFRISLAKIPYGLAIQVSMRETESLRGRSATLGRGSGTASRVGETLHIELGDSCGFDAKFNGDKITLPGALPDGCSKLCTRRASYAGLEVSRLSESAAEAAAMRDANGKRLCGD